jgi:hypothetical protein
VVKRDFPLFINTHNLSLQGIKEGGNSLNVQKWAVPLMTWVQSNGPLVINLQNQNSNITKTNPLIYTELLGEPVLG